MQSPERSILRTERGAIAQLELWLLYQRYWCEHKPSITVYVHQDEWMETGAWVYKHFDEVSGVSFLPYSDHTYVQAPFIECSEEDYNKAVKAFQEAVIFLDWNKMVEIDDNTIASQEPACVGGACLI